jgi:molybdenum cofactor cytidylyltransferase
MKSGDASRAGAGKSRPRAAKVAAIVLAAGRSSRMGALNKLLIGVDGKPMLRHVLDAVLAVGVAPAIVVTGHERSRVAAALQGLPVTLVHNPDYARGLSTSLKTGLTAVPDSADAALICLGDMPCVTAGEIRKLIGAFAPQESRAIVVPTRQGKRGNPVLLARRFFAEMQGVAGDAGARHLIDAYPESVAEIEMASDGALTDIDTPQALARLARNTKIDA